MKAVVWRAFKFEGTSKIEVPVPLNNPEENCTTVEIKTRAQCCS